MQQVVHSSSRSGHQTSFVEYCSACGWWGVVSEVGKLLLSHADTVMTAVPQGREHTFMWTTQINLYWIWHVLHHWPSVFMIGVVKMGYFQVLVSVAIKDVCYFSCWHPWPVPRMLHSGCPLLRILADLSRCWNVYIWVFIFILINLSDA